MHCKHRMLFVYHDDFRTDYIIASCRTRTQWNISKPARQQIPRVASINFTRNDNMFDWCTPNAQVNYRTILSIRMVRCFVQSSSTVRMELKLISKKCRNRSLSQRNIDGWCRCDLFGWPVNAVYYDKCLSSPNSFHSRSLGLRQRQHITGISK